LDQMKNLSGIFNTQSKSIDLNVAGRFYIHNKSEVLPSYKSLLKTYFDAEILSGDFENNYEPIRKEINSWIYSQTNQKISDIFPVENSLKGAPVTLVGAIYFKGAWKKIP